MTDLRKAAEMALETLEDIFGKEKKDVGAINALRQALAMERFSEVSQEIEEALKQPKREWVGLTEDEKQFFKAMGFSGIDIVEAKLKEKNT